MFIIVCAACLWLSLVIAALAGVLSPTVQWRDHRLSVETAGTPIAQILAEIARKTGLRVEGADSLRQSIDAHFANLPLSDAISQLLVGVNFALIEHRCDANKQCLTLIVWGERPSDKASDISHLSAQMAQERTGEADQRLEQVYQAADKGELHALQLAASAENTDATRAVAMDLLAQKDPSAAANIALSASSSADIGERVMGLQALAGVDSPAAIKSLRQALDDPDDGIRETALAALAQHQNAIARRLIEQAADDPDPSIQTMAEGFLHSRSR